MKKLIVVISLIALIGLPIIFFAESTLAKADDYACAEEALAELSSCLASKGIGHDFTKEGDLWLLYVKGQHSPGQVQSCLAYYNQLKRNCPEAPVIINTVVGNFPKPN